MTQTNDLAPLNYETLYEATTGGILRAHKHTLDLALSPPTLTTPHAIVAVCADGGVIGYNPSPIGGTYAFCMIDDTDEIAYAETGIFISRKELRRVLKTYPGRIAPPAVDYDKISNNLSELIAITLAIESLPPDFHGAAMTDSGITRGRLFFGWAWDGISDYFRERAQAAVARMDGKTHLHPILLAGHPSEEELKTGRSLKRDLPVSKHNKFCDDQCKALAAWYMEEWATPELPPRPRRIRRSERDAVLTTPQQLLEIG